jgi:hypothetical protein
MSQCIFSSGLSDSKKDSDDTNASDSDGLN